MNSAKAPYFSLYNPVFIFLLVFAVIYIVPLAYLSLASETQIDFVPDQLHLFATFLYFIGYLIGVFFFSFNRAGVHDKNISILALPSPPRNKSNFVLNSYSLYVLAACLASVFVLLYYFNGGSQKLFLYGSDIDSWDFRITGYDDRSRVLTALLELARRGLFPISLIILTLPGKIQLTSINRRLLPIFWFIYFLGSIVNLDRGPIFLFIAVFVYIFILKHSPRLVFFLPILILFIGFLGAIITNLQYNLAPFDNLSFQSFFAIVFGRIILDPPQMGQLLSFSYYPYQEQPLFLAYSRLGALFGASYVGTSSVNSFFVAPCGLIGDVWRNFGMAGEFLVSFFHGFIFSLGYFLIRFKPRLLVAVIAFLYLLLSLYLFYSGMFSQGPFIILALILFLSFWGDRKFKF